MNPVKRNIYMYLLSPIDYWEGFVPEEDYLRAIQANQDRRLKHEPSEKYKQQIEAQFAKHRLAYDTFRAKAFELGKAVHWEGDILRGPFVSMLPGKGFAWSPNASPLLVWKQSNNGATFLASLHDLPWLGLSALEKTSGSF